MFSRLISAESAAYILDFQETSRIQQAVDRREITPAGAGPDGPRFAVADVVMMRLAEVIRRLGVDDRKAVRYSEAILGTRLRAHDENLVDWIENEAQELFCLISDGQLSRIYLRNKEDFKEFDVGAVKPVLFPTTRCEINVFRVIRPVVYRARQLLAEGEGTP
ncbi:MAG: hypothetical protein RDU20_10730 [Desulfomonilaceae bacterium]|nr:hypothetical protein [Desulfomonilaceae bacterium]